jgi:hypothetical protein
MPWPARVECYAGYKADERPVRFEWAGRTVAVDRILAQWTEPAAAVFRVTAGGSAWLLRHSLAPDSWTVEPCPARMF